MNRPQIRRRQTLIVSAGFTGGAGRFRHCRKLSLHGGAAGSEATSDGVQLLVKIPQDFDETAGYSPVMPALSTDSTNCFCRKKYITIRGAMESIVPAILIASLSLLVDVVDCACVAYTAL